MRRYQAQLRKQKITKRGYIRGSSYHAPRMEDGEHLYIGEIPIPGCSFVYAYETIAPSYRAAKEKITAEVREFFGTEPMWGK